MAEERDRKCQAISPFTGSVVCERCALAWDAEDPTPPECKPLTLDRLMAALAFEATRIEASQAAAVAADFRKFSHHEELERAQLLRAGVRLVRKIIDDDVVRTRLARQIKPKDQPADT